MKIVIDSDIPYIRGVLEPYAGVVYLKGNDIKRGDVADADALIIRTRTQCDRKLLEGSQVKLIATATIGFDHIDMEYCRTAAITVSTAAGSNARGVLQWIGGALAYASQQQGWQPAQKTLGVVGIGHVGSLVARYAGLWGFNVLCCDPPRARYGEVTHDGRPFVGLDELSAQSDIITFHVPLSRAGEDATLHMADSDFFGTLRGNAVVINSSRGEVIDTAALNNFLRAGRGSAIIDTWENEPVIDLQLLDATMLATPHIAGYSAQGKANATAMSVQAVAREFGLPLTEWYPSGEVPRIDPQNITWQELLPTIFGYFDIASQSAALKASPRDFEQMRNDYHYRTEYF